MSGTRYNQFCALARAAEIVGERWTLLIIRELLLSPMRFGDLRERLDDISPALLTDRLNALVEAGVVQRAALPAPFNAQVYELTETGRAIQPAIRELIRWGRPLSLSHAEGRNLRAGLGVARTRGHRAPHGCAAMPDRFACSAPEWNGGIHHRGWPRGNPHCQRESSGIAAIEARFDVLLQILGRHLPLDEAVASGAASIEGSAHTLRKLPSLFELATAKR